jgi:hypothetical protein
MKTTSKKLYDTKIERGKQQLATSRHNSNTFHRILLFIMHGMYVSIKRFIPGAYIFAAYVESFVAPCQSITIP